MDFGVGFLSNNVMVPILDFFYGIVPSYGLAIIFLTLVVRLALFPLNAGSIRNMRKMRVVQPIMQKKLQEAQERYANDPEKLRETQSELYKEFGNPLGGCLPLLVQMPLLFALFATLRGSPFADVTFDLNLQILAPEVATEILAAPFATDAKNIYLNDHDHRPISLTSPVGQRLAVGQAVPLQLQATTGRSWSELVTELATDPSALALRWQVSKGEEHVRLTEGGILTALEPGEVTVQAVVPGLASHSGFLFIQELGHVGAFDPDGTLHWDVIGLVVVFGLSTYASQTLSQGNATAAKSDDPKAAAQNSVTKITPVLFSGMFLFFPLPTGVLMYIVVSNLAQMGQTFILSREPLAPEIQKLVDEEQRRASKNSGDKKGRDSVPFER